MEKRSNRSSTRLRNRQSLPLNNQAGSAATFFARSTVMKSQRWRLIGPLVLVLCLVGCSRVAAQSVPGLAKDGPKEQVSARLPAISGHVYRADTGAPLAKAVVTLYPLAVISNGRYPRAETQTDGSYRFYDVVPRSYTVAAACEGFVKQDY